MAQADSRQIRTKTGNIKILEVIPVTRSTFAPESLSYFSTKNAGIGDLVKINLRNKETFAIVAGERDVLEEKASLKKIGFKLKPVSSVVSTNFFPKSYFKILNSLSNTLYIPKQLLLSSLLPKPLLSKNFKFEEVDYSSRTHSISAYRGTFEERVQFYKGIIRQNFAEGKSLIILTPAIESLEKLSAVLSRGIEKYAYSFSSDLTKKQYLEKTKDAINNPHPVLIIGTYQTVFLDRQDLETLVVDEEGSKLWYLGDLLPFDLRQILEIISLEKKMNLIYADNILRIETIYKADHGQIEKKNVLTGRIQSNTEIKILELQKSGKDFRWISEDLIKEVKEALQKKEKILFFVNRKGYGSFTICLDCGTPQTCPNCSIPAVIHLSREERKFVCHHCLKSEKVWSDCQNCNSWNLKNYGLGIEKVEEEFKKSFPKANTDAVTFATESVFLKKDISFDLSIAVSLDNLFTIPDFRINDSIFRIITKLKSITKRKLILQTRMPENKLFTDALSGNITNFYQDEINSREKFSYPPFSKIIKLTKEDKDIKKLLADEEKIIKLLKDYDAKTFTPFYEKINKLSRRSILIKLPENKWDDPKLKSILENISQLWEIRIDPESII